MGSEVILPGTPRLDIPAHDRPVFDASLQNGYAGLAGGGSPSASSLPPGVTKETVAINTGVQTGNLPAVGSPYFAAATIAAGANETLIALINAAGEVTGTLVIQALGAVTSGAVLWTNGGAPAINITKQPGGTLVVPDWHYWSGATQAIVNTDAAAQAVTVAFMVDAEDELRQNVLSAAISTPAIVINRQDVLRIRQLQVAFGPAGTAPYTDNIRWSPHALLRLGTGPLANGDYPTIAWRRLVSWEQVISTWQGGDGANNMQSFFTEGGDEIVIAGSDSDMNGQGYTASWSPYFWVNFQAIQAWVPNRPVMMYIRGLAEIFRNANQ